MIDPTKCVEEILHDDASRAIPLFALLTWAADHNNLKEDNNFKDIMDSLYAHTDHSRKAQEAYSRNIKAA